MSSPRSAVRISLVVICLFAGLIPIVVVHGAWWWNLQHGLEACNPYWDGCVSVSRGVRSGPGLWWFKLMSLPMAVLMVVTWLRWPRPPASRGVAIIGVLGACFFLVYALALGTDGELYRWMRRYGVVFYFGLTGIAQLWLTRLLSRDQAAWFGEGSRSSLVALYLAIGATWLLGVLTALKRRLLDTQVLIDRAENALEWGFSLGLSLVFIALAAVLRQKRGDTAAA